MASTMKRLCAIARCNHLKIDQSTMQSVPATRLGNNDHTSQSLSKSDRFAPISKHCKANPNVVLVYKKSSSGANSSLRSSTSSSSLSSSTLLLFSAWCSPCSITTVFLLPLFERAPFSFLHTARHIKHQNLLVRLSRCSQAPYSSRFSLASSVWSSRRLSLCQRSK